MLANSVAGRVGIVEMDQACPWGCLLEHPIISPRFYTVLRKVELLLRSDTYLKYLNVFDSLLISSLLIDPGPFFNNPRNILDGNGSESQIMTAMEDDNIASATDWLCGE